MAIDTVSSFRERILEDADENTQSPVQIAINDFFPLFSAISLLPLLINASVLQNPAQFSSIEVVAVITGTFTSISLIAFSVTSFQTKAYGRYLATMLLVSLVLLTIAVPKSTVVVNRFGLYFAICALLAIDIFSE